MDTNRSAKELRNERMLNEPINKIIPRLAVPTIIAMIITAVYNVADTYFVSQLGTSASGAVGVVFSAMMIIQALSFTIGIGSGTSIAKNLGAGQPKEAEIYVAVGWFTGFGAGCILAVLSVINIRWLVMTIGATETIAPYAMDYSRYIFFATPFMMCSFIMNNQLRFQGLASYGMVGIASGGILNMILDPIFIFGLGMGTAGAGLATGLSQFISFCILLFMCNMKEGAIRVRISNFKPSIKRYVQIFYVGAPSFARQGLAGFSTMVLNLVAGPYGDAAIAALSIVSRCCLLLNSVVVGFGQGFQPVCSFSYGAKRYRRVRDAYWYCVKVATIILLVLAIIMFIFSGQVIALFRKDDPYVIHMGTFALRAQLFTLPLWGYYVMSNMFSQSIGYGFRATLIACARQGLVLIPVLMVLPRFMGLNGLLISQPFADLIAVLIAFILVNNILKELNKKERESS